jgi:hypothetical protein
MGEYWKLMGEYDSETTDFTEFAGGGGSSPYSHDEDAQLIGLRTIVGGDAATTLTEHGVIRLTSTTFKPNAIECAFAGGGLRTAPFTQPAPMDHKVDQKVLASIKIKIEGKNLTADTPVTNSVLLMGLFRS